MLTSDTAEDSLKRPFDSRCDLPLQTLWMCVALFERSNRIGASTAAVLLLLVRAAGRAGTAAAGGVEGARHSCTAPASWCQHDCRLDSAIAACAARALAASSSASWADTNLDLLAATFLLLPSSPRYATTAARWTMLSASSCLRNSAGIIGSAAAVACIDAGMMADGPAWAVARFSANF